MLATRLPAHSAAAPSITSVRHSCGRSAALRKAPAFGGGPQLAARHFFRSPALPSTSLGFKAGGAWWKAPKPDNCVAIDSVQHLVNELEAHREQLVVVEFYATWCTGCRALLPKMVELAQRSPSVRFLLVDADDNRALARRLGVKGCPSVLLFAGAEGCVESFNVTAARIHTLSTAIDRWNVPRCSLSHAPPLRGFEAVKAHTQAEEHCKHAMA